MSAPEFNSPQPSLSDAINKLMANPEILSTVASALGNMNSAREAPPAEAEPSAAAPEEDSATTAGASSTAGASPTSGMSATPDLGELLGGLAPMMSRLGAPQGSRRAEKREADRREALLCALKPYVSEGRREAIDYIIRISQISDILKNLQH